MSTENKLNLGIAYHGNRMPHHAREDLISIARNGFDTVVHMLSHTDWDRHKLVMKDIVSMSEQFGLDVWVDNWGLGGPPGDKSHFLAYYPEAHARFSDGTLAPVHACLNSPEFRKFTYDWIDAVRFIGGKTIFWDEPHLPTKKVDGKVYYACTCDRCKKLFEERYNRPMPEIADEDVIKFGVDSVVDYFKDVTAYSASFGIKNIVCVMLGTYGMSLSAADAICTIPTMQSIGSDPYWLKWKKGNPDFDVYDFVYNGTKENLDLCERFGKEHNIWIQTYSTPKGEEDDIILAAEAAYDAGARTILAWGYYGSESNDYGAKNPEVTWARTCDAFARLRNRHRDELLAAARKKKGIIV
ncbi:MAG: hypothetical protein E7601_01450 [Ruminococcaceae bacterium]|nr:hypothetical protein [Oscillospiraceae bacterium]